MTSRPRPYDSVAHLVPTEYGDTPLDLWEAAALRALRSRALYQQALDVGRPFEAGEYYSLFVIDRAAAALQKARYLRQSRAVS